MRLRRGRDFAERELVAFVAGSAGSLRGVRDVSTTTCTAGPASAVPSVKGRAESRRVSIATRRCGVWSKVCKYQSQRGRSGKWFTLVRSHEGVLRGLPVIRVNRGDMTQRGVPQDE